MVVVLVVAVEEEVSQPVAVGEVLEVAEVVLLPVVVFVVVEEVRYPAVVGLEPVVVHLP